MGRVGVQEEAGLDCLEGGEVVLGHYGLCGSHEVLLLGGELYLKHGLVPILHELEEDEEAREMVHDVVVGFVLLQVLPLHYLVLGPSH